VTAVFWNHHFQYNTLLRWKNNGGQFIFDSDFDSMSLLLYLGLHLKKRSSVKTVGIATIITGVLVLIPKVLYNHYLK
jgi:hypothetical protein